MRVLTVTLHPSVDRLLQVDRLRPGEPMQAQVICTYASGKGINAARALQRLGDCAFTTGFQGGSAGDFSIASLAGEGVELRFIPCQAPTRTSTIIYERQTGKRYTLYEPRQEASKAECAELLDYFGQIVCHYDLCLLCGAGEGPNLETMFQKMIQMAHKQYVPCMLDSSGASLFNGISAGPTFVKINLTELTELAGCRLTSREDQLAALKSILAQGASYAAVSNQAKGLLAMDQRQAWAGKLATPRVINTLGCGDAMLAGMAHALLRGWPLPEIVNEGVACGAANTQSFGAGFLEANSLEDFRRRVELRRAM